LNNKLTQKLMKSEQIIYASEVEEFFWEDSDISVPEGTPVGYEKESENSVDLILFDDIYWSCKHE
tara:strand:- start:771 stop:965 length:195 start_codon:yes stop_codon:yes gene_type:complete